ncbi:membrane dipeptidase [Sphaerisporangium melleum]|uniref:Membrane dipeptidase n=1 Tax=Sphaerisporangium melleum TaxID=321316 RepID=A0A917RE94_9ACTN|nr:membrane dipeptidase [Sphaerisporangium melleum]GGL01749.1 membrane dipeptidase [Sphaerisporangium melleum]GII72158.1 membrane dipeptidase [Sphaerisporangium melleum]
MTDRPWIFAGHSDFIAGLADYDMKGPLTGAPRAQVPPADLAASNGLGGGLFEVMVPPIDRLQMTKTDTGLQIEYPPRLDRHYALDQNIAGIGALLRLIRESKGRVRLARTVDDFARARQEGAFAVVLHLADADAIDTGLETLYLFHAAGVRSLAITWSRQNSFGYGVPYHSPGTPDIGPGLTEAGTRLVRACNELGILVDLAHLNTAGFWDIAACSQAPLVVTHGAAHALSPTSRALTDDQIVAIADSGGVIGVSLEGVAPSPVGIVSEVMNQIRYLIDQAGPDHVALGSDLYRSPNAGYPGGAVLLPKLLVALRDAGYDDDVVTGIAYANWQRVLHATW